MPCLSWNKGRIVLSVIVAVVTITATPVGDRVPVAGSLRSELSDNSRMLLEAVIPESGPQVKTGQETTLQVENLPGVFRGRVIEVAPPQGRNIRVTIRVP